MEIPLPVSASPAPANPDLGQRPWRNICRLGAASFDDPVARLAWQDAWTSLWGMFRPAMVGNVRRLVGRMGCGIVAVDEADDIVQRLLLACLEHVYPATSYPEGGRFRAYVTVCLRRHTWRYIEHQMRMRRPRTDPSEHMLSPAATETPSNHAFEKDWVRCLVEVAMMEVAEQSQPDAQLLRHVLSLSTATVEGLTELLGIGAEKVLHRVQRARSLLAAAFQRAIEVTVSDDRAFEQERARFDGPLIRHLAVQGVPAASGLGVVHGV